MASTEAKTMDARADHTDDSATRSLLQRTQDYRKAPRPASVDLLAKHCLLDWTAVALAGAAQPATQILLAQATEEGGTTQATLIGQGRRATARQAALINGTASHALDYDDVNMIMMGHASVAIMPAALACGELRACSGRQLIDAFVTGYETACYAGWAVSPSHYANGFHGTVTIGTLGAAAACAGLMGLDTEQTGHALGIAITQAAGLKSMFGSMCKPLHAGKANENGLLAAQLAARGFTSRLDAFECTDGFAQTHSEMLRTEAFPAGFSILATQFKYHASCYVTHAMLLALAQLRASISDVGLVDSIRVLIDRGADTVCNIAQPATGLEVKFSLRMLAAFALHGIDTSNPESFEPDPVHQPELQRTSGRVSVLLQDRWPLTKTVVEVVLTDGRVLRAEADTGIPEKDLDLQTNRLTEKAMRLIEPRHGAKQATNLIEALLGVEKFSDINELTSLLL